MPKWDKVLYKTKNKKGSVGKTPTIGDSQVSTFTENSNTNTASQGVFFIPLQSTNSNEIKAYITAYKHNDSLYTYRLYNKDSLDEVHANNAKEKSNLLSTQAVFGFFEKSVNNNDSVSVVTSTKPTTIKDVSIKFDEPQQNATSNGIVINSFPEGSCDVTISLTIEFAFIEVYNGSGQLIYGAYYYSETLTITISCSGGGGGGCGCGSPIGGIGDPSGGTPISGGYDPNNPSGGSWWNSGTGWPWNNPYYYAGYDPSNPNPFDPGWGWWWNGGGSLQYDPDLDPLSYPETQGILMFESDYRNQMSLEEQQISDNMTRLQQLQYLTNAKHAIELTQAEYPTSLHNGNGDAFRHAYFSALNAKVLGVDLAKQLGDAHELKPGGSVLENQMDLFNNQVGRDAFVTLNAAGQAGHYYKTGLAVLLKGKIQSGDLRKLSPLDPSDNIIPGVSQLVPTN